MEGSWGRNANLRCHIRRNFHAAAFCDHIGQQEYEIPDNSRNMADHAILLPKKFQGHITNSSLRERFHSLTPLLNLRESARNFPTLSGKGRLFLGVFVCRFH